MFCVSLDPVTNSMAVTGGEDDKAYVWTVSDGEVLFECTGECYKRQCVWIISLKTYPMTEYEFLYWF